MESEPVTTADTEPVADANPDPMVRVANDLERIAAHLVPLLKASYSDTTDRLQRAERVIATRRERPAIAGLHKVLCNVRRLDRSSDIHDFVEGELMDLLTGLGYQEFGSVGDPYDPVRHEGVGGRTEGGRGRILRVHRRGLACYDDVMIRAVVEVSADDSAVIADAGGSHDEPIAPTFLESPEGGW